MIPKVIFRYSSKHDKLWKHYLELYYEVRKKEETKNLLENYSSSEEILNYIEKVEPEWNKWKEKTLESIERLTGLKWQEPIIKVYLVGKCVPYSDPLTMQPQIRTNFDRIDDFIDILVHELIHQIQSQNHEIFKKWIEYLHKNYPDEKRDTQSHIFLHAVHKKIYLELFGKDRLERNLERSSKKVSKKRSWEIVEEDGHEEIINKFKEIIMQ